MERIASDEERIRRAEEIYYRRKAQGVRVAGASVNVGNTRRVSLGKRVTIQIFICVAIYITLQMFRGYNNFFSEGVINQVKTLLSYDINFKNVYNQFMEYFNGNFNIIDSVNNHNNKSDDITNVQDSEEKIDNANEVENDQTDNKDDYEGNSQDSNEENMNTTRESDANGNMEESAWNIENQENAKNAEEQESMKNLEDGGNIEKQVSESLGENQISGVSTNVEGDGTQKAKQDAENKTQMEQDAEYIKQNCNIIKPIQGVITSGFGSREQTEIISAFHQGIDISATTGTPIYSAMSGTVVAASYAGEYGNHIKIQNGDILTVYAHCSELEVKVGDWVSQKQEIGKVGATGKVTGPHLHFEIRRDGRYVDPEMILSF